MKIINSTNKVYKIKSYIKKDKALCIQDLVIFKMNKIIKKYPLGFNPFKDSQGGGY